MRTVVFEDRSCGIYPDSPELDSARKALVEARSSRRDDEVYFDGKLVRQIN